MKLEQAILTHSKFSKSWRKGEIFENSFSFRLICNTMSSENDYLYAKFASALATPMWHFMKTEMEEVRRKIFLVSKSVYFRPC